MARGKKVAEVLTPEVKLEQALVPECEQPYRVPENWCWIQLLSSFENNTDSKKRFLKKHIWRVVHWLLLTKGRN